MLDPRFSSDLPLNLTGAIKTPFGILLPPGGRVAAYVCNSTSASFDESIIRNNLRTTLADGLRACRPNFPDTVVVLPGHSENVVDGTMLDNLTPGTRVIGVGEGSFMPTFRWTAAGANWAINDAGCIFQGLRIRAEGANGIASAITVSAADCALRDNDIEVASGAALKSTIFCTVAAGADRFSVINNRVRGTETHNLTDGFLVSGAVRDLVIARNRMMFSATAANGLIRFTAAALGVYVGKNVLYNSHTTSTSVLTVAAVAADGVVEENSVATTNTGAQVSLTNGFNINAACLFKFFDNLCANDPRASGMLLPTVDT